LNRKAKCMSNADEVVQCARVMRRYLSRSDLLGNDAASTDCRMEALLTRAVAGEDVADALRALIGEHQATREWAKRYLQAAPVLRGYKVPPGTPGPVPARCDMLSEMRPPLDPTAGRREGA
jgi:hypothetical protein